MIRITLCRASVPLATLLALGGCEAITGGDGRPEYELIVARPVTNPQTTWTHTDLFLIDPFDPGPGENLTRTPDVDEVDPAWSPEGQWIAYTSSHWTGTQHNRSVWRMRADGGNSGAVMPSNGPAGPNHPAWSPDGSRIAYVQDGDLHVAAADGSGSTRLHLGIQSMGLPSWSPNGTRILFHGGPGLPALFTVNPDGTGLEPLHTASRYASGVAWSPDGRRIAYAGVPAEGGRMSIFVADADGSGAVAVSPVADGYLLTPTWSPDGQWIAYQSWSGGCCVLAEGLVIRADGSGTPRSLGTVALSRMAWRP